MEKKIKDKDFQRFLDETRTRLRVQDESDQEFIDQANRFYTSHKNIGDGRRALIVEDDIDSLPKLTNVRIQEFAFRYAMEPRTCSFWAAEFRVTRNTILGWLKRRDVIHFITALRRQRYLRIAAKRVQVESKVFDVIMEMLNHPLSDENFESKRRLVMDLLVLGSERTVKKALGKRLQQTNPTPVAVQDDPDIPEMEEIDAAISIVES